MKKTRSYQLSKTRFLKAYYVTFRILLRYFSLFFIKKIISPERASNLSHLAHERTAKQIYKALLELKGLYIKIGQTISVMGNFLPENLTKGLESLQDNVPPHPFEEMNQRFLTDFGKTAGELFKKIDPVPIASASLGQVHVAFLESGEKLAVKLQYPNIDEITKKDLKTIKNIFGIIHFIFPNYNLKNVYQECAEIILKELDYKNEAENIERVACNFKDDPNIIFPKVYEEFSSEKVLTLSFVEGAKVTNTKAISSFNVDKSQIATKLIHFYCKQIFIDGVFHADPHPGNIIITPDGKIAMLDFGAVATISPSMRKGLTLFVEGLIKKDARILSQSLKLMGFVAKKDDDETLNTVVEYFYSKISGIKINNFKNLDVTQFHSLGDLVELKRMDISLRELTTLFIVPRDWIMLERAIILMMGLTAQLDDKLNPVETVIPYVEKFLLGTDNKKLTDMLVSASKDLIIAYLNLPDDIRRFIKKMNTDGIKMVDMPIRKELSRISRSIKMFAVAVLFISSGILSYLMYETHLMETGFRFEMGSYAFGVLFLFMLFRRK